LILRWSGPDTLLKFPDTTGPRVGAEIRLDWGQGSLTVRDAYDNVHTVHDYDTSEADKIELHIRL